MWSSRDRDEIDWNGTITAKKFKGDGSLLTGVAGTGEINTASSVGTGAPVFKEKSGVDLIFKTLKASGARMWMHSGANEISFEFSGAVGEVTASEFSHLSGAYYSHSGSIEVHFASGAIWTSINANTTGITALSGAFSNASAALYAHINDITDPHGATLSQTNISGAFSIFTGTISSAAMRVTADQVASHAAYVSNTIFGSDSTPPTASGFPEGTIYVQYKK